MPGELDDFDMAGAIDDIGASLDLGDSGQDPAGGGSDPAGTGDPANPPGAAPGTPPASAPAPAPAPGTPPAPAPAGAPAPGAAPAPAGPSPAPGPNDPPNTWRPEAKAEWANLSPTVKAEIHKREQDMWQGVETYKADADRGKTFNNVFKPYEGIMRQHNIDPVRLTADLAAAHNTLATGDTQTKAGFMARLIDSYRVDKTALAGLLGFEPADPANAPYVDPQVARLQAEVEALKSNQGQISAAEASRQAEIVRGNIEAFYADSNNIYLKEVGHDMANLLEKGVAKDLADAYQQAIWRNPAVRAKEVARTQQAEADAQKAADAKKVEDAKKASTANVKAKAKQGSAAAPSGTWDDTMAATLKEIESRTS